MIDVRLAKESDAQELYKLNELFNGEGSNTIEAITESLKTNKQEIICVAAEGDVLVGFCCGQIFKSMCYGVNYGEITELFVMEDYRRRSVASRLVSFIETEFHNQGIDYFQLFTNKENKTAQSFYEIRGYTESNEKMYRKNFKKS